MIPQPGEQSMFSFFDALKHEGKTKVVFVGTAYQDDHLVLKTDI